MRAVWSFWSKPFRANFSFWKSELHHLFSWVVSVETARKHYPKNSLFTDDDGARMLVDGLGLPFESVSTRLNDLHEHDPSWWAFGKVYSQSLQEEPYVHLDSDVYLWSPLPERLVRADVIGQNPEAFSAADLHYRPDLMQQTIRSVKGWVPIEMSEYVPRNGVPRAVCCGIVGGCHVEFLRHYAGQAIRLLEHPSNRPAWPLLRKTLSLNVFGSLNVIFEQHLLMACLDYHRTREESAYSGIQVEFLFRDFTDARRRAPEMGFTHLLGMVKQEQNVLDRLENRVRNDYPTLYERCLNYLRKSH